MNRVRHSHAIWLDHLPALACERIVQFVARGEWSPSVMALASLSVRQREAVMAVMQNSIFITSQLSDWTKIALSGVRTMYIGGQYGMHNAINLFNHPQFDPSSVASIEIENCPAGDGFKELTRFKGLQSFRLWSDRLLHDDSVLRFLDVTNLRELRLGSWPDCPFSTGSLDRARFTAQLLATCVTVGRLTIECSCPSLDISHLVRGLPCLRHITLDIASGVMGDITLELRRMKTVRLINRYRLGKHEFRPAQFGPRIGRRVVAIEDGYPVSVEAVKRLEACGLLESLHLVLRPGAECALRPLVRGLRKLDIAWDSFWVTERDGKIKGRLYYSPPPGLLLSLVRGAPFLESLSLLYATIALDELIGIMQYLGSRLVCMETSVVGQLEQPERRLIEIMRTATAENRRLQRLRIADAPNHPDSLADSSGNEAAALRVRRTDELKASLSQLLRNVPSISCQCADDLVQRFG